MRTLEESWRDLEELDRLRNEAASYRAEGQRALKHLADKMLAKRGSTGAKKKKKKKTEWDELGNGGEDALVLKALSFETSTSADRKIADEVAEEIGNRSAASILGSGRNSIFVGDPRTSLALLNAGRCLTALANAPTGASTPDAFMVFYYVVVRELYMGDTPDWSVGGARAAREGRPTAYVTSEFVRGLLSFERSIQRTITYLHALALAQQEPVVHPALNPWYEEDRRRRALVLYTTLERHSWNLVVHLGNPVPPKLDDPTDLAAFPRQIRKDLIAALGQMQHAFTKALDAAKTLRKSEIAASKKKSADPQFVRLVARSATAHAIAEGAIDNARAIAVRTLDAFKRGEPDDDNEFAQQFAEELRTITNEFSQAARQVRRVLEPCISFLSGVLDHQITAALTKGETGITFDPTEMACAAATLGAIHCDLERERGVHAAHCLSKVLTEDGFPGAQPFYLAEGKTRYHPSQYYVLGSFAQLLERVPDEALNIAVVDRMLQFFRKRRRLFGEAQGAGKPRASTWSEDARWKHVPLDTAMAVSALDRISRTLDHKINTSVLSQFSHKHPTALRLRDLFYPDYGSATAGSSESLAIVLERMCAHVSAVKLEKPYDEPLYSAIFYGPPGTGKTTLAEALAASCDVPLVEITPSDIVIRGGEMVEARARVVFKSLSLLTGAVILFDEFEEVLGERRGKEGESRTIFHFLTPGMLPKLKTLYEAAKERRLAYVLLTNVLETIDEAASRPGRFDVKKGVYPPDLLSRAGRLFSVIREKRGAELTPLQRVRCVEVIRASSMSSMEIIGKPSWFSLPKDKVKENSPFAYILGRKNASPAIFKEKLDKNRREEAADPHEEKIQKWESDDAGGMKVPWLSGLTKLLDEWSKPAAKR